MPEREHSSGRGLGTATASSCPRCGTVTQSPFGSVTSGNGAAGTGGTGPGSGSSTGICLRCAGERIFAIGSGVPFEDFTPAEKTPDKGARASATTTDAPDRIGSYEIIEELGRGGMARVFAARQSGLGRIVALKILPVGRGGNGATELELRFLREAQTVARFRHPHIVGIHESGRAGGYVYFSMDYIEGGDLARRLRERPLPPREVAILVGKVAGALAYAHAEGVLHRDLKPSNILLDGDEPRLADFGLAAQLEATDGLTTATGVLGTPHYLAPEALHQGSAALTVASDLYALGVVLYEMLAGRTPFAGVSPAELAALIDRTDPPSPRLLNPAVPRDLETICLKCLERDPARRYANAAEVAEDLRRFLAGEQILARAPTRVDAVVKFAGRHQAAVAATVVTMVVLAVATGVSLWLAVRATRAEKRAATEAAAARAVTEFLQNDLLAQASPDQTAERDLPLRTVLDRAAKMIDGPRFAGQPLIEAAVRETIANTYASLGQFEKQQAQLEKALELRRKQLGPEDPLTLDLMDQLFTLLAEQGKIKEAVELGTHTLEVTRRVLGPENPQTLHAMNDMIFVTKANGKLAEAEKLAADTLATARRALGPVHTETRNAMINLSSIYFAERKLDLAEPLNLEAVAAEEKALGPDHPDTLTAISNLSSVYWAEGKMADAERSNVRILEARTRILGPEHPETLRSMNNLAAVYTEEAKYAAAAGLLEQTLAIRRRAFGEEHQDTLSAMVNLGLAYYQAGRIDEASQLVSSALGTLRRTRGPEHFQTLVAMGGLAMIQRAQGQFAGSEAIAREALTIRQKVNGPENSQTLLAIDQLGDVLLDEGKFAEAQTAFGHELAVREKNGPKDWRLQATRSKLGAALAGLGRRDEAKPLVLESREALDKVAATVPPRYQWMVRDARKRAEEWK